MRIPGILEATGGPVDPWINGQPTKRKSPCGNAAAFHMSEVLVPVIREARS